MHLSALEWPDVAPLAWMAEADPDKQVRKHAAAALRRLPLSPHAARTASRHLGADISPARAPGGDGRARTADALTTLAAGLLLRLGDPRYETELAALDAARLRHLASPALGGLLDRARAQTAPGRGGRRVAALLARCSPEEVLAAVLHAARSSDNAARRAAAGALAEVAPLLGLLSPPPPAEAPSDALARVLTEGGSAPPSRRGLPDPSPELSPPFPFPASPPESGAPRYTRREIWGRAPASPPPWADSEWADSEPDDAPDPVESLPAPARTAYARLDAPRSVTEGERFPVVIGLAPRPAGGVMQPSPFTVPTGTFLLRVQLMADGFTPVGGMTAFELPVSREDPHPRATVELVADRHPGLSPARTILAVYTADGHNLGVATRSVHVTAADAPRAPAREDPLEPDEDWSMPSGDDPDVSIVLKAGDDVAGTVLLWSVVSRHPAVPVPAEPVRTRIDAAVPEWASRVRHGVEERKGGATLRSYVRGVSALVGDAVPEEVWAALTAAAGIVPRPTVLLTTAEPYIPWELARVPEPWLRDCPSYLGAQAVMGRWIYRERGRSRTPEARVEGRGIAVVRGDYRGGERLPEAEREADHLRDRYGATLLSARFEPVLACLEGRPEVTVLHFAVHGRFDPDGIDDGILMEDGEVLDPINVRGVSASRVKVVVLNACQVGQGHRMLGDYAGMAAAFLAIGASAVVAPLWRVDDAVAGRVAAGLYGALGEGRSPAEYLAEERARADGQADPAQATSLAYLFFGHPRLRVEGPFSPASPVSPVSPAFPRDG
ncbi:hypothetical protein GCM10017673_44560 [Streptosporangium violaceochromogenes]|nr:hypothetical protein GCM10017673_44560 [Streptosporangium violaceochromogenes]